jgi:hypothetical protein
MLCCHLPRRQQFSSINKMVKEWDHVGTGYKLEVNRFADMLPHEMDVMRRKPKGRQLKFPFPGARNYTQQQPFHLVSALPRLCLLESHPPRFCFIGHCESGMDSVEQKRKSGLSGVCRVLRFSPLLHYTISIRPVGLPLPRPSNKQRHTPQEIVRTCFCTCKKTCR